MAGVFSLYSRRETGMLSDTAYWKGVRDCTELIQRLKRTSTLEGHRGCVNTIAWNSLGSRLISGADDRHLKIYDTRTCLEFHSLLTTHQSNIFSARFLPSNSEEEGIRLVSCAGVGSVEYSEISPTGEHISHPFHCHRSITYQVATTPGDGNEFMTCEEQGQVRLYDLRVKTECLCEGCKKDVLCNFPASVSSMAVHPLSPYYVAFGLGDGSIQVLDRRMIGSQQRHHQRGRPSPCGHAPPPPPVCRKYSPSNEARKITSVQFNHDGTQLLASYSEDFVYLFNSKLLGCGSSGSSRGELAKSMHWSRCEGYSPAVPRKRMRSRIHMARKTQTKWQGSKSNDKSPSKDPPIMKKLRLRGDWSDTGPEACPEGEGSGSRGWSLMNHMSNMFSQWIDMSLSSDEQEREGGAEGGARRRPDARRGRGRGEEHGDGDEESGEGRLEGVRESERSRERLMMSSSSSDNSSCSADERGEEAEASASCEGSSDGSQRDRVEEEGVKRRKKSVEGVRHEPFCTEVCSRGECTGNEVTTVTPDSAHCIKEGSKVLESKASGNGEAPLNKECSISASGRGEGGACSSEEALECNDEVDSVASGPIPSPDACENIAKKSPSPAQKKAAVGHGEDVLVEDRALSAVPTINIIEDETDSDDDENDDDDDDDVSQHLEKMRSSAARKDSKDRVAEEEEEKDNGGFGSRGSIKPFMVYKGHRNSRTMIKQANFFGDNWVLSGSDCGRVFVWDKWTGKVVNMLMADNHVVNCVQPHPQEYLIATSGIDYNVKFWEPMAKERCSLLDLDKVIERNTVMLEESRNTITMPSMIFLRVLSYLNRRRRRAREEQADSGSSDPPD